MYKLAVIVDNFNSSSIYRGAGKGFYQFYSALSALENVNLDLITINVNQNDLPLLSKVNVVHCKNFQDCGKYLAENKNYDLIISDFHNSFANVILNHSHSLIYRHEVVRTKFEKFIKSIFNPHRMLHDKQRKAIVGTMNHYKGIIANSVIASEDYKRFCKVPQDKIHILTPYIEVLKGFEYELKEPFVFGASAVSFSAKGGFILLESLQKLKKHNNDFKMKVIYPNYEKNLVLKFFLAIYGLGQNIEFLNTQTNMDKFYDSIDCLVVPSREETFGLVVPEAMARGKFCIISSRCGACDIIEDGKNGFVFDFEKSPNKKLFEKMKYVLDNKHNLKPIAQNAYNTITEYSFEDYKQNILKILQRIKNEKIHI